MGHIDNWLYCYGSSRPSPEPQNRKSCPAKVWSGGPAIKPKRGCTLAGSKVFDFVKDRKSVILGVWAAPGAPETRSKGGGRSPPPFGRISGAPGAAQTPKMTDFRPSTNYKIPSQSTATIWRGARQLAHRRTEVEAMPLGSHPIDGRAHRAAALPKPYP